MKPRAAATLILYFSIVSVAAVLLGRTIYKNASEANEVGLPAAERGSVACATLVVNLRDELFAWYAGDVKALGPDPLKRQAFPGTLREWEAARGQGALRCTGQQATFDALLRLRRTLESNAYLLSQTAGVDIAAVRGAGEKR